MRVYQYLHTPAGGHMRYVEDVTRGLQDQGAATMLVVAKSADTSQDLDSARILNSLDYSARRWRRFVDRAVIYPQHILAVLKFLRAEQVGPGDVFHLQELPTIFPQFFVRRLRATGATLAITIHNVEPHERDAFIGRWLHSRFQACWKMANLLVVHSESLIAGVREVVGNGPRVVVIPHAVWATGAVDARRRGASHDFLFFGQLRRNKGIEDLVAALSALGDPSCTIAGAGDPRYEESIRAGIERAGLEHCRLRAGFVPESDIPELFADHTVLVAPYTHFEAQSGVTHLAIAYDVPVVVTDCGGLPDPVRQFGVGEVVGRDGLASAMRVALERARNGEYEAPLLAARAALSTSRLARRLHREYEASTA